MISLRTKSQPFHSISQPFCSFDLLQYQLPPMPTLLVPSLILPIPAISKLKLKLSSESKPFKFKSWRLAATRDVDAFTEKSSYLFQLSSTEADSLVDYDLKKIGSIYRRKPLILLRRIVQVATSFGWWFGSRYVDKLMERSDQMFKVRILSNFIRCFDNQQACSYNFIVNTRNPNFLYELRVGRGFVKMYLQSVNS